MAGDSFYWSKPWRALRARVLRDRPTCEVRGCGAPASHVDHITTRQAAPHLALDARNLQSLCHSHHSEKTARTDGGFGNRTAAGGRLVAHGCDADGNPRDPLHHWRRP
jgi:5-methylcytosine-specific restriction endonuclease McrA